jgi:hypothetical protein
MVNVMLVWPIAGEAKMAAGLSHNAIADATKGLGQVQT